MANNYPTIRPTLNMNFAGMGVLPPDVTFTRASTSGGYYDGKTAVKAEENLFVNSVWAGAASGTPGTPPTSWTTGSTGGTYTVSGSSIQAFAATGARHFFSQTINVTTGTTLQITVDVDAVSGTGIDAVVLAVAGTATFTGTSLIDVAAGTGRKTITLTITGTGTVTVRFGAGVNSNVGSDCTVTMKAPQAEIRSAATAYTPTTTAPITNYIPKLLFAPANVPVFDHNPVTGEALGLSVWEARTNLLLRSQEFGTTWTATRASVVANQIIAPDGTLTADKLVENTDNNSHLLQQSVTITAVSHTYTVYAKAGERSWLILNFISSGGGVRNASFNLSTGALGTINADYASASITPAGNGWYRCSVTRTATAAAWVCVAYIGSADNTISYTGDGTSGIYIWGAQLEAGAFATPYIPTVASTVARSADVAVMTGVNFSRWFNNAQGALVVEGRRDGTSSAFPNLATASDGTANNRILISIYGATNQPAFDVVSGGATQCALTKTAVGAGVFAKVAASYQTNSFAMTANGASVETDTLGTIPVVNQLRIGSNATGTVDLNGYIRSLSYYPIALTSAQLQAVTA